MRHEALNTQEDTSNQERPEKTERESDEADDDLPRA